MRTSFKWFMAFLLLIVLVGILLIWKFGKFHQKITLQDVPKWTVTELTPTEWELQSVEEPARSTTAWFSGVDKMQCDTMILVGGVQEGKNLLDGGGKWKNTGNSIVMKQPVHSFLKRNPWKEWSWYDWWMSAEGIKKEYLHTLGALDALTHHVLEKGDSDQMFTQKLVLAGGSLGSSYPVILTSFYPEKVSGVMVVYGFTNYSHVSRLELYRHGLIHLGIEKPFDGIKDYAGALAVNIISSVLSTITGNILKYGQIELYLPDVHETPVHFINGLNDPLVPPEAYMPMWKSANEPKSEEWIEGHHIDPGNPEELKRVSRLIYQWADSKNLRNCYKLE